MLRPQLAFYAASLILITGCFRDGAITPHDQVITEADERDYGFLGEWQVVSKDSPETDFGEEAKPLKIKMTEAGHYQVESDSGLIVTFRTAVFGDDSTYAIIDLQGNYPKEMEGGLVFRSLCIASRQKDHLYVWWIQVEHLAEALHADDHSGVIVQKTFSDTVYAKPDELLATIRKHSKLLVSSPMVLRHVGE